MNKFDVKIFPTRWGNTPMTALDPNKPEDKEILDLFVQGLDRQSDLHIQVSIPNEFQPKGKKNIGITAVTEASIAPMSFIEGANRMDLILVPSQFTKDVLLQTKYDRKENDRIVETIQCHKPVEVLFEGLDTNVFRKTTEISDDVKSLFKDIKEEFCFLFTGHYLQGRLGQDRKDVGMLCKVFIDTFKNKKKRPALILKTSGAGFSITERDQIIDKINQIQELVREEGFKGKLPSIYLINGDLSDEQMNELYNHSKVKAMVSFTKGEGFGLPLLEFTATGKPVICSAYSGPLDFLNPEYSVLLPGKLTKIDGSAANEWLPKEGEWFTVSYQYAGQVLSDVFENYDKYLEKSRKSVKFTKDNFSLEKMTEKFLELLEKDVNFVNNIPKQVQINLPQLKKIT
jgi:glycosyltransferase involved in cell wall biosynthesis